MKSILQISEGVYPPQPSASVDNTLLDLQNSSCPTKAEFNNNCLIIHSKYFPVPKGVLPFWSLFFRSPKLTQSVARFSRSTVQGGGRSKP